MVGGFCQPRSRSIETRIPLGVGMGSVRNISFMWYTCWSYYLCVTSSTDPNIEISTHMLGSLWTSSLFKAFCFFLIFSRCFCLHNYYDQYSRFVSLLLVCRYKYWAGSTLVLLMFVCNSIKGFSAGEGKGQGWLYRMLVDRFSKCHHQTISSCRGYLTHLCLFSLFS